MPGVNPLSRLSRLDRRRHAVPGVNCPTLGPDLGFGPDTTKSIIDEGPWTNEDEGARYYYLLDVKENQPSSSFPCPDESDHIWWFGFPRDDLPQYTSDIPEANRYRASAWPTTPPGNDEHTTVEPRRYGNTLDG